MLPRSHATRRRNSRPSSAASSPGGHRTSSFSGMHASRGYWNPLASRPKIGSLVHGGSKQKFNMYTPRRLEAITPREARSLPTAFSKSKPSSKVVRPKTCFPRIKGSPAIKKMPQFNNDLVPESDRPVLGRVVANGTRLSLLPRTPLRKFCPPRLNESAERERAAARRKRKKKVPVRTRPAPRREEPRADSGFATAVTAGLLTEEQLEDLLTRELTPEDFELLLQLDELNDKKYKTVEEKRFETFQEVPAPDEKDYECRVCLELMKDDSIPEADEEACVCLPCCQRVFHKECISKWLKEYSKTCPSCRADLQ